MTELTLWGLTIGFLFCAIAFGPLFMLPTALFLGAAVLEGTRNGDV